MKVKPINWISNYRGFLGTLSDSEAERWKEVIRENVPGVTTTEVDYAMAAICSDYRAERGSVKPNAMVLIDTIMRLRNSHSAGQTIDENANALVVVYDGPKVWYKERPMFELRRELARCADPVEAWNIICAPLKFEHCKALHEFADKEGIEYQRYQPPVGGLKMDKIASLGA